jgi:hypothetical protein
MHRATVSLLIPQKPARRQAQIIVFAIPALAVLWEHLHYVASNSIGLQIEQRPWLYLSQVGMFPGVGDQCEREAIRLTLYYGERHPIEDNEPFGDDR